MAEATAPPARFPSVFCTANVTELFTSARMYEYVGALAPKGQEGRPGQGAAAAG